MKIKIYLTVPGTNPELFAFHSLADSILVVYTKHCVS